MAPSRERIAERVALTSLAFMAAFVVFDLTFAAVVSEHRQAEGDGDSPRAPACDEYGADDTRASAHLRRRKSATTRAVGRVRSSKAVLGAIHARYMSGAGERTVDASPRVIDRGFAEQYCSYRATCASPASRRWSTSTEQLASSSVDRRRKRDSRPRRRARGFSAGHRSGSVAEEFRGAARRGRRERFQPTNGRPRILSESSTLAPVWTGYT
jgi:hypothetical protein